MSYGSENSFHYNSADFYIWIAKVLGTYDHLSIKNIYDDYCNRDASKSSHQRNESFVKEKGTFEFADCEFIGISYFVKWAII